MSISLPEWHIKIDGQNMASDLVNCLTRVEVESSMNIPAVATLHLNNLPLGATPLKFIDATDLDPGKALSITVKVGSNSAVIFDGEVVEVEPTFEPTGYHLVVRAFDMLHRLSRGRKVKAFTQVNNQDILTTIMSAHGLTLTYNNSSGPGQVYEHVLQNGQTDLDFARDRAALMGCHCFAVAKAIHCVAPKKESAVATIDNTTMISFCPRLTTIDQVSKVTVRGWTPKTKEDVVGVCEGSSVSDTVKISGKNGAAFAAAAHSAQEHLVADWPVDNQSQAQYLAKAVATSISGRFVQAEGKAFGNPAIKAGAWVEIKSVGNRYSGTYFVTNALHTYDATSGYNTEFTVSGHDPTTLLHLLAAESNDTARTGLQIAVVTEVDPKKALVKLRLPHLGDPGTTGWARVAAVGAGATRGIQFLPEVGDEVIVGFERGDIDAPYVLGGLWNGKDTPPAQDALESTKVATRVIQSRSGHMITFDDKEAGGGITIKDSKGDTITISAKDTSITIESKKDIIVKATGNLTMSATGDAKISGMNVNLEGQTGVSVKGVQVKVNADAEVEIKGGIVKLN